MSFVTSAIIMVVYPQYDSDFEEAVTEKDWDPREGVTQSFVKMTDDEHQMTGGIKFMEVDVYMAGFNYVSGDDIEQWFHSLPWGEHGRGILIWDCNGESGGSATHNWNPEMVLGNG